MKTNTPIKFKNFNQMNEFNKAYGFDHDGFDHEFNEDCDEELSGINLLPLASLWDEPITYVKQFAEALNSVQLGYFMSYFSQKCQPNQWIALNDQIIQYETALTPKQWRKIRQDLMARDLLLNKRTKNESLFTLNDELLEHLIKQHSDLSIESLISPVISINTLQLKALCSIGVDIKAIILLATAQYLTPYQELSKRQDWSEWIVFPANLINKISFLSVKEQSTAIKTLKEHGIIECVVKNMPATRYCRFSLAKLGELTAQYLNIS